MTTHANSSMDAAHKLDLLAEASGILVSSPDIYSALQRVADLCASGLAEYCAISLHGVDGTEARLVHGASSNGVLHAPLSADGIAKHLETSGYASTLLEPLRGRNHLLGTLVLAARQQDRFSDNDRKLARILSNYLGSMLNQAELYRREHRVADRLQRALLPAELPTIAEIDLNAAYRPASDEAEVGGDWYDAFVLPDGTFAISIGDVAGHGLGAAVVMGEIRHAVRAASVGASSPAEVLESVNEIAALHEGARMVTALHAIYDPATGILRYASAGHPPPIFVTDEGRVCFLPLGGIPLGVDAHIAAPEWTFTLSPGSAIVLYTDGLLEYDRDLEAGERTLLETVKRLHAARALSAQSLQDDIFRRKRNDDDAATVLVQRNDAQLSNVTLNYSAVPLSASLVRSVLRRIIADSDLSTERGEALVTAVGEAVANAIEHAYGTQAGTFSVQVMTESDALKVCVEDYGRWRSSRRQEERGRGIALMKALVDGVKITTTRSSTAVTLTVMMRA